MSIELDVTVQSPIDLDVSVTDPIYLDLAESAIIYIADANPTALTHNSLVSIQGGTTAQYYHTTYAQWVIATQAASTTLAGYLTAANFIIFNNKLDTNGSAANLTNFPSSLATITGSEALTNKTYNGLTLTSQTIGFTITGGTTPKTLTIPLDATVSGTNTGDNSVNTLYSGLVSNATHTGDVTGSTALTLATVNSNIGSFGSTSVIPIITVNAKGLITAVTTGTVTYAGSALTGTSLASNILTSSLTTIGTLTDLTVTNTITGSISGSAPSLKSTTTSGVLQATGMTAGTTRVKTVRDSDDTILELGGSYTPTGTWNWGTATVTWPTFNQNTTGTATNATNAVNSAIINATTNDTMYPVWVTANTGNLPLKTTSSKLTFNPSTGNLSSTTFTGNFVGNLTGNVSGVINADTVVGLVVDSGQVLTVNQTMTLYAADNTGVYTFPTGTNTLARTNAGQTFTGVNTFTSPTINTSITSSATFSAFNDATALTIGSNTAAQTINFGTGATINGATKTINIGTGGVSGSITQINIGSTYGTTVLVNDDLTVTGDLTVNGTTFTVHSGTVIVEDKNIELGSVTTPTDTTADGGGITLKGASDKTIIWDNANDNWTLNQNVNVPTSFTYKINNTNVLSSTVVLGLTPTIQATGFALAGGTSSKTITVNDSCTISTNSVTLGGGEVITFSATNALSLLTTGSTSVTLPTSGTLVSSVTTGNGVSATNTAGALAFTLGVIAPTSVNGLTLASQAIGFTIAGGTTSKTLTVPLDASVSGTNTGDQTLIGLGGKPYHGIQVVGTLAFNDSTKEISVSSITYWYKGTIYTTASPILCDLDLTADRDNSSNTLTTNTLYYIYFKDSTGKLYWSDSSWNMWDNVFVATVFWNGTNGALQKETHGYQRNIDWHIWAHDTIGTRYENGATLTYPTTSVDNQIQIETGSFHDEDNHFATGTCTTVRGWYKTGASTFTFANYSLPYIGSGAQPQYLRTSDYSLQNVGSDDFVCYWVYASPDIARPIYIIPTHATAAYNTLTNARNETTPVIIGTNASPELKLIYKFIYKGDGNFRESVDYRSSSPVPGGGSTSVSASSVSFAPAGDIASTSVQAAIVELDTEKLSLAGGTMVGNLLFTDNTYDIGANGATRPRTLYLGTGATIPTLSSTTIELGHASDTTLARVSAGLVSIEGVNILMNSGPLGTPSSGTVTNLTGTASININGTVGATTPTTIVGTTVQANTGFVPDANDGAYLGTTALGFSDLFLASGAVINYDNGNTVLTHSTGVLTLGTGTFKITTPTNTTTSVVTIDGTQTLTNKTVLLTNNTWLTSYDSLGVSSNILKLASDNTIDFGATVNLTSFNHLPDSLYTISNVPVADSVYGTEVGINIVVGGTVLFKATALSDGAGGLVSTSVPSALTTKLTQITHTAPGTADYAIQDLVNSSAYGFVTKDEGNTVLSVILNLQQRVDQLETRLISMGIIL